MAKYKILKQFISVGQEGDPEWATRNVYVLTLTSGSWRGDDVIYDDFDKADKAQDKYIKDDKEQAHEGWGIHGEGRLFLLAELDGNNKIDRTKFDFKKEKKIAKEKKDKSR